MKLRAESGILEPMKRLCVSLSAAAIVLVAIACAPALLFAQDVTVPMPGEYGASNGAVSADELPDPAAILNEDGSSFSIPIPGGGEIQVQGPESEAPQTIAPTEQWSVQRNTPFSVGGTPMGPAPAKP